MVGGVDVSVGVYGNFGEHMQEWDVAVRNCFGFDQSMFTGGAMANRCYFTFMV